MSVTLDETYELMAREKAEEEGAISAVIDLLKERDRLREGNRRLLDALEDIVENIQIPDVNCACHVSPPCSDCVEYGGIRESLTNAHAAISKATDPVAEAKS